MLEHNIICSNFDKAIRKDGTAGEEAPEDVVVLQASRGILKSEANNLIYLKAGKPAGIDKYFGGKDKLTLEQWRKAPKGRRGKGIRVADPRSVNAAEHDYRPRDDSPALDMGIHSSALRRSFL